MAYQLPPEIANPLKELLQQDAQPAIDAFVSDIQAAGNKLVANLPPAAQAPASLGWNLLTAVAAIAAHGELAVILKHNVPTAS